MINKKAAMEMSMGTIVTIVLLMSVLVLGIFFVQKIFDSGNNAIDSIDNQVQNEINKLFSSEGTNLAVYPSSLEVTIKKGSDASGFAFSVYNDAPEPRSFKWEVKAETMGYDLAEKCGSTMTEAKANSFILLSSKSFNLPQSGKKDIEVVKFQIPKSAPSCVIPYTLIITADGQSYEDATIYVTIK